MALDDQLPLSVLDQAYKRAYPRGLASVGAALDKKPIFSWGDVGSAMPEASVTPETLASQGGMVASMLPGAGIADILGLMPNFRGGYNPSFGQNVKAGQYGQAALQTLGGAGDVMMAIPAIAPIGALAKAARGVPGEISRAAAETAKEGITQPALRQLYGELGLTGQQPTVLAGKALNETQPQELIDRARELKLADRRVLANLTDKQKEAYGHSQELPEGLILPSDEAAGVGSAQNEAIKKEVKKAEDIFDQSAARGQFKNTVLFDLSPRTLMKTPPVMQFNLPRVAPEMTERLESASRGGMRRLESAASQAPRENWGWYNLMQARDLMHAIHGPEQGEQAWHAWLDSLAGTSMVNPIDNNVRASTWYLQQVLQGKALPYVEKLKDESGQTVKFMAGGPPPGYGAKSQIQHADRVREYLSNTYDPVKNPKPISYRMNLGGNWMPRTVDTHDIRNAIGMPLALDLFGENASLLPKEYAYLEALGGRAAQRAGTSQAAQQAATWIGGGQYTKLKSFPAPLLAVLNRRAHVTAMIEGKAPDQALIDAFSGKAPLR